MASSGYSGGGVPDLFGELTGRSSNNINPSSNNISQNPYRTTATNPQQIFLDQTPNHLQNFTSSAFIGKRTLSDFHHHQSLNPSLNNLLLRSVKPRMSWPQPPYLRPHNSINFNSHPQTLPYMNALHHHHQQLQQNRGAVGVVAPDSEKKKMMNQLHELEKQLLDDDDAAGTDDTVSVITSEWSDTIQTILNTNPNPNPAAPSPTSSSSSSSSTNSVFNCSKQTLLEAASALSEGKFDSAAEILGRITHVPNPKANSEQKLMDFMLTALKSRLHNTVPIYSNQHMEATHLLYQLSPCFRLSFMAANSAILHNLTTPHVIDFDIGQATQYVLLLHALSARKPASLKLTAVSENGADEERLRAVGHKLTQLSDRLGVSFKFSVVICKLSELSRESLGCDSEEELAVNLAFKLYKMADESVCMENPRDHLLRRVKGLSASVVTIVEQEMNCNTATLMTRVNETWGYYGALLESMESEERVKEIEEWVSGKIVNSVGCEGRDRVERSEVYGKWRARMGMAGFHLLPINQNHLDSIQSSLHNPGFTVKQDNGGVCLGWMGKTLTVASAWR